jgi:hypothetical protein
MPSRLGFSTRMIERAQTQNLLGTADIVSAQ